MIRRSSCRNQDPEDCRVPLEEAISVGDGCGRAVDHEVAEFKPLRLLLCPLAQQRHEPLEVAALDEKAVAIDVLERDRLPA